MNKKNESKDNNFKYTKQSNTSSVASPETSLASRVSSDSSTDGCRGTRVKSKHGKEGSKQTSNVIPYNIQYQRQHKNNHAVYARVL